LEISAGTPGNVWRDTLFFLDPRDIPPQQLEWYQEIYGGLHILDTYWWPMLYGPMIKLQLTSAYIFRDWLTFSIVSNLDYVAHTFLQWTSDTW